MENQTFQSAAVETAKIETASAYEAPRVESVLTSDDMEREILYAGTNGTLMDN